MAKTTKQKLIETDISKSWKIVLTAILFIYIFLSYCQKQNLLTADLGRHIKNGEYFLEHYQPIVTNYYSYTQTEFPTRTHHWGAGVIYYILYKIGGFGFLGLLNVLLYSAAFLLFFKIALRKSNYIFSIFFSLLSLPLIIWRLEIRPEVFSYLFVAIYYYLLSEFTDGKIKLQWLLLLPLIQILWVNIHILFPLGLFLIGIFGIGDIINKRNENAKKLGIFFGASSIACLINFFGIQGIIEPFTILDNDNYGMTIVENMTVYFMWNRFPEREIYYHVAFLSLISLAGLGILVWLKKWKTNFSHIIILIVFGAMAWKMIRNFPLFGYLSFLISAISVYEYQKTKSLQYQKNIKLGLVIACCIILSFGFIFPSKNYMLQKLLVSKLENLEKEYKRKPSQKEIILEKADEIKERYNEIDNGWLLRNYYSPYKYAFGLGLMEGCNKSADFIKQNHLEGPWFNNYDIGGYFIFHLFPKQKPFVDNRPEAYSVEFFHDMFIPMQEDTTEASWKKFDSKFQFNAIYFYRHDQTPYGQPFLIRRVKDPEWIPVFVDDFTVILLRNNEKNKTLIHQYKLDKSMFVSVPA
jgi:hypothetical protein